MVEDEELTVDEETLWSEYFETLDEVEVSCIHLALDEDDYDSMLERKVVSGQRVTDRHELEIWGCLTQENAVDLYLSAFYTFKPDGDRTDDELAEINACHRSLLQYADFARYLESAAVGTSNGGRSLMSTSLGGCSRLRDTELIPFGAVPVYEVRPINFAPNQEVVWRDAVDVVSPRERDCVRSELGADRYELILDEAVLDGITEPWEGAVWRCLGNETAASIFKDVASFGFLRQLSRNFGGELERDNEICLEGLLTRIDIPRLIEAGLPDAGLDDFRHGIAALIGIGLCIGSLPSIIEVDDHSDGIEGATEIAIGSFVEANLDAKFNAIFDQDVFQFIAASGLAYELDLNYGVGGPINFTGDEQAFFSIQVAGPDGRQEFITSRPVLWEPSRSGVHELVVAGAGPLPYEFEVSISDYVDDFGDSFESATEIPIGGSVEGTIGPIRENDYFSFRAEAGDTYQIDVSLEDDYRADLGVNDLRVDLIGSDRNRIGRIERRRVWEAPASGVYFLRAYNSHQGSYSISISVSSYRDDHADSPSGATEISVSGIVEGAIGEDFDQDYFYFDAESGESLEINVESEFDRDFYVHIRDVGNELLLTSQRSHFVWVALETGRYFIRIWSSEIGHYALTLDASDYVDDHRDNEATAVLIGQTTGGYIFNQWDRDLFSFVGVAGQAYEVAVEFGTLDQVSMWMYDAQGVQLKRIEWDGRFTWQAPETGTYYVYLRAFGEGTYSFTVFNSDYRDDHGDDESFATQAMLGETVSGVIGLDAGFEWNAVGNTDGDHDVFSFAAERGQLYSVEVEHGSLLRSSIKLFDAAGDLQSSGATRIVWEAERSGKHFVRVSGLGVGDYELTVDLFDYSDDHGNDNTTATPIEVGETLSGTIGLATERDFFRFMATEGEAYQIRLISDSLEDREVSLFEADGTELGSDHSFLQLQALASKDYYIVVSSREHSWGRRSLDDDWSPQSLDDSEHVGEYSLSIKLIE